MFKKIKENRAERKAKSDAVFRVTVNVANVRSRAENDPHLTDEIREKVLEELDCQTDALIEAKVAYDMEPMMMGAIYVTAIISYILGLIMG